MSLRFSDNDAWIVSSHDNGFIYVWNTLTGSLFFKTSFSASVNYVEFLPLTDPKYIRLASVSMDGLIRIWCFDLCSQETTWILENDGWLIGNDGNLLFWVPSDLRSTLVNGPPTRILDSRFSTKLTLSENQGTLWTACHRTPPNPTPIPLHPNFVPHYSSSTLAFCTRFIPSPFMRLIFSSK